ncbi:MAG: type II toxin-antitoxin system VapC family toxin [Candidatus Portnoybacteria bacterium]|nr:type II toxin-antitoxin system VapC family toxin [Candidatus Portnoybacteria bacterium]
MPLMIDTSILIDYLRGYAPALRYLDFLSAKRVNISVITAMEVLQGTLSKKSFFIAQRFLSHFQIIHLSESISKRGLNLQQAYHISHSLSLPDSFIAATALERKSLLITRNVKDFSFIGKLKIEKPYFE